MRYFLAAALLLGLGCAHTLEQAILEVPYADSGYAADDLMSARLRSFQATMEHVLHVTIEYQGQEHMGAAGFTNVAERYIIITQELSPQAKIEVLAHEGAHMLEPWGLSRAESEVFADAVSYEVCKRLGFDTRETVARYLAGYKQATYILRAYKMEIAWAATVLSGK